MKYFKPILGILLLVASVYLCFQLVPPYFKNYQFQDYLDHEATRTSYSNLSEDTIRNEVLKEARNDDLPITAEQIHVTVGRLQVQINVDYTVHVDLPFFPTDLHFNDASANKGI
ncbi:MAG TPA: hypothetical protein VK738_16815 [Terriglobales bacterium]|jgi:hypothetical protein|nr:hypothetical protein [Terriglobales bacterium]